LVVVVAGVYGVGCGDGYTGVAVVVGGGNGAWRRERRGEGPGLDTLTLVTTRVTTRAKTPKSPKHPPKTF
jgi:hypothetical protein